MSGTNSEKGEKGPGPFSLFVPFSRLVSAGQCLTSGAGGAVRIAIVDSGVHASHPHVGGVAGGVGIDAGGQLHADYIDRLGHGTAVTAAIRERAPRAELLIAKVFDTRLAASADALIAGIDWAIAQQAQLINLSLGTTNPAHAAALGEAVSRALAAGAWVVAAGEHDAVCWLPGTLPGVVSVTLDWLQPREACVIDRIAVSDDGMETCHVRASGWPRPIPGVPPERNLKGVSFAVASVTGLLSHSREATNSHA